MALEDRIRTSVDQALQSLAKELQFISDDEIARHVSEAEQRLRAAFDEQLAESQERQRQETAEEVRAAVDAEGARISAEAEQHFEERLQEAVAAASAEHVAELERRFDEQLRTAVADAESRAVAETQASIAAARAGEREQEMAGMTRLVESIRGLDGATSLSEVLDALALAAARETARAAVLVIKGDRAVGWRLSGFGVKDTHPKSLDMPVREAGVIGLAATSARIATTQEGEADGPGFEHLPADRQGLAVPVLVGGRVVAVLYADGVSADEEGVQEVPSPWPEAVEVLARHAGRCLEALTAQKASGPASGSSSSGRLSGTHAVAVTAPSVQAGTAPIAFAALEEPLESARRLARLLVSEIRMYNEGAMEEGRRTRELLRHLAPQIASARAVYESRVPSSVGARGDLFHQEIVRTLAGGDGSLLGTA